MIQGIETDFNAGLREARVLSEALNSRVVGGARPLTFRRSLRRTVLQLKASAFRDYQAGLALLENAFLGLSAESLVRCIVEDYAHLYWLLVGEDPRRAGVQRMKKRREARCLGTDADPGCAMARRALCLEFGLAGNRLRNVARVRATTVARLRGPEVRQYNQLKRTHDLTGCVGTGRDYGDVSPLLTGLHGAGTVLWAHDLYVVNSEMVHGVRRELMSTNPSVSTGVLASDRLPIFLHGNAAFFSVMTLTSWIINGKRTTSATQAWLNDEYGALLRRMHLVPTGA